MGKAKNRSSGYQMAERTLSKIKASTIEPSAT